MREKKTEKFKNLEKYYDKYDISEPFFNKVYKEIKNFKVAVPFIGPFSSGKTSLINAMLGKKIFKTGVTPETDIPVEIFYSQKHYFAGVSHDDSIEPFSRQEFDKNHDIKKYKYLMAGLDNPFLEEINKIVIVDMPGFESGIEAHNRAIDNYLEKSKAYIIVNNIETGTVTQSVLELLGELNILEKPVYSVINKYEKQKAESGNILALCRETMEKIIRLQKIGLVSAKKNDVKILKEYLREINSDADKIFDREFEALFEKHRNFIINYINIRLKNSDKSFEELEIKKEELGREIENLRREFENACSKIRIAYDNTIEEIESALNSELMNKSDSYAAILVNGGDVKHDINLIVRRVYMDKVKNYFEPKMLKHFEFMENSLTSLGNIEFSISIKDNIGDAAIKNTIQSIIIKLIGKLGPIGQAIVGIITDWLFGKVKAARKLEQAKANMRSKIPEIINTVVSEFHVGKNKILDGIFDDIKKDIDKKEESVKKAIEDIQKQIQEENERQEQIKKELEADLEALKQL